MPKSKRARIEHLSKVDKKTRKDNDKLFEAAQDRARASPYIYVFQLENVRTNHLQEVRKTFLDSRIYFGKTKLLARALGLTPSEALLPGLDLLAPHVRSGLGLIMTPRGPSSLLPHFASYAAPDYARAGAVARRRFALPPGPLFSRAGEVHADDDVPLGGGAEPGLRKLGVPVAMERGRVVLADEYVVCEEGQVLDARQTALLKMFGVTMVDFRVIITAYWEAATGAVVEVEAEGDQEMES